MAFIIKNVVKDNFHLLLFSSFLPNTSSSHLSPFFSLVLETEPSLDAHVTRKLHILSAERSDDLKKWWVAFEG